MIDIDNSSDARKLLATNLVITLILVMVFNMFTFTISLYNNRKTETLTNNEVAKLETIKMFNENFYSLDSLEINNIDTSGFLRFVFNDKLYIKAKTIEEYNPNIAYNRIFKIPKEKLDKEIEGTKNQDLYRAMEIVKENPFNYILHVIITFVIATIMQMKGHLKMIKLGFAKEQKYS